VQHKALRFLAQFFSYLLHPVFLPTLALAMVLFLCPETAVGYGNPEKVKWLITAAYTSILFPLLTTFLLWRLGFISSLQMPERQERYVPLIASMLFYFWIFWIFHKQIHAPHAVQLLLLHFFITTVGTFMLTIFHKTSLHTAAWVSFVAFSFYLSFQGIYAARWLLMAALLGAGLVSSSRLYLQAHTQRQVITAAIIAICSFPIALFLVNLLN
jgi:hypothetical protein